MIPGVNIIGGKVSEATNMNVANVSGFGVSGGSSEHPSPTGEVVGGGSP